MRIINLSNFLNCGIEVLRDGRFSAFGKINDPCPKNSITFFEDKKYRKDLEENINHISAIITFPYLVEEVNKFNVSIAISQAPKASFIRMHNQQRANEFYYQKTRIERDCKIASSVSIPEYGVCIGHGVTIEDNVKIFPGVKIGNGVSIKYGSLIGSEEYERCFDENKRHVHSEHLGLLLVGNNVNIDEYVAIDKPLFSWDTTLIEDDCYIGKKVLIAHGSKIGSHTVIGPSVTICGNTIIGCNVKIGVGSIISSRISIGDSSIISIGSVANKDVNAGNRVTGNLAISHDSFIKHLKGMINENGE